MKNPNYIQLYFILFLAIGSGFSGLSQNNQIVKANEKYEQLGYIDALKIYEKVAEKGYGSEEVYTKLGNSYYFNAQYDKAAKWYEQLFKLNEEPQDYNLLLRYSQALKAIGSNASAQQYYDAYLKRNPSSTVIATAEDYLDAIKQNSDRYDLKKLDAIYDIENISFGSFKVNSKLIYASTMSTEKIINRKSAWDGLNFLSLYEIALDKENNATGKPKRIEQNLNERYHESSLIYTKDQNTIYYTASNNTASIKGDVPNLKIYKIKKVEEKWTDPEELKINSDLFSTAHPALNSDETKLYFASDRPGGFGESDIYVASVDTIGNLGVPVNLGEKVNTSGKDSFPYISDDNELYFSSDGHFGLGGLDVFYIDITEPEFGHLLNVGEPINSYADDFAYAINFENKRGFVSSSRTETVGSFVNSNIYTFLEKEPIKDIFMGKIHGTVTDIKTGEPIENSIIFLADKDNNPVTQVSTDSIGNYEVEVDKTIAYFVKASKEKYDTEEKQSKPNLDDQEINFQLQPNIVSDSDGTDLADVLNIPLIYFDYDKWDIREDAKVELEKIVATLDEYPSIKVNIRAHTDSRGKSDYNQKLSERRAKSTLNYLVAQGIDGNRLAAEGLGESELLNSCTDTVECTEAEHQKNRRSQFVIKNKF